MSIQDNIDTVLSGSEIEPNGVYDFRLRQAHTDDIPRFRGLPGQLTVNPDDKNRLSVWKGTELGEKEDVPFISDLKESTLDVDFKSIKLGYVKETVTGSEYIIDPDRSNKFFLNINSPKVFFKIKEGFNTTSTLDITLYLTNIIEGIKYTFDSSINWMGNTIELDTTIASSNILCLSYKGTEWIAYALDKSINDRWALRQVEEAITSNARLLGWFLPSGSTDGEISDRYASATTTSLPNLSDEDLRNISRVSAAIYDIIDVANSLEDIHKIEDYVDNIKTVAEKIEAVTAVAPHIYTLAWINSHLDLFQYINDREAELDAIYAHLNQIVIITDHVFSVDSVAENIDIITSVNAIKDSIVINANKIEEITKLASEATAIANLYSNIDNILNVNTNIQDINTTASNIATVNAVGIGMNNIDAVADKLPQLLNILNNIDNIKELGNYINKGVLLRTVLSDNIPAEYTANDTNKIYCSPCSMFNSIEE